jgi:hypothetical protein
VVDRQTAAKRRRWADVVIILASLYAMLAATFAPTGLGSPPAVAEAADHGMWWWAHAIGGTLALSSVFVAMKSVVVARLLAGAGGVVLLAGVGAFGGINWLAIRTLVIPALLILAATPFLGPMPSPEEEGQRRKALGEDRGGPHVPPDPDDVRRRG